MDIFNSEELKETVSSLNSKLGEKAALVQLYPLFKQATSSSEEPTPGYMYEALVEFSYNSQQSAQLLADYLNRRLQRHSAHGVLKTLKCIRQLVERGPRAFRHRLRATDEHVKRAPDYGSQRDSLTGSAILADIRALSAEILTLLFDPDAVARDCSNEPEIAPQASSSFRLTGMGSSSSGGSGGRYEGFGSSPQHRPAGLTDKVRDMIESVLNTPDPKQQVLELCLKDSKGSYEPASVDVDISCLQVGSFSSSEIWAPPRGRKPQHIPGRAGGGWEEEDEEQEKDRDTEEEKRDEQLLDFRQISFEKSESVEDSDSNLASSSEYKLISSFCRPDAGLPFNFDDLLNVAEMLADKSSDAAVLGSLKTLLREEEPENTIFLAMLVLEKVIEEGILTVSLLCTLRTNLERLKMMEEKQIAIKAAKIHAIINQLSMTKNS